MVLVPKDKYLTHYTISQILGYRIYSSWWNYGQHSRGIEKSIIGTPYILPAPHSTTYTRLSAPASFSVSPYLITTYLENSEKNSTGSFQCAPLAVAF